MNKINDKKSNQNQHSKPTLYLKRYCIVVRCIEKCLRQETCDISNKLLCTRDGGFGFRFRLTESSVSICENRTCVLFARPCVHKRRKRATNRRFEHIADVTIITIVM
ncbi:hypothetical protein L596_022018 [Steinernema carpocapsae]|uniref:Uncharacterized protein n=1 Tax=Steinernema carpocapsae TaxID=34508 RepID=A0A4U5MKK6_STECR|nr:hypothetical protein L596_022018 [Steinernema carpocapsae]